MPATIVIVHDEAQFVEPLVNSLRAAEYAVTTFPDALAAMHALEDAKTIELLVTRIEFPPGRSNGAALANMARVKRPSIKVLFIADLEHRKAVSDLGELIHSSASPEMVAAEAIRLLSPDLITVA